jgi:hypothetical protein
MAQSPDTKNPPPVQNTQPTSRTQNTQSDIDRRAQAAENQSFAAENAAVSGMQTAVRRRWPNPPLGNAKWDLGSVL